MNDLSRISDADLQKELELRSSRPNPAPERPSNPDFQNLIKTVIEGVAQSITDGYENDDFAHYVYEEAMTAIYGKAYWEWRRKQKW